jgi:hypothetical protein
VLTLTVAATLAGNSVAAEFPRQVQAGDQRLVLNGWGSRTQFFLELYVAGLYLAEPNNDPAAIAAADQPMSIRIKIKSGFVSQAKLVESLSEGFQQATGGNVAPIRPQIDQFRKCFAEAITKGDTFDIVYLPQHGVIVNKNGKLKGVIAGLEFKKALFNIWLSDNPADEALKHAMLVRPTRR